MYVCLSQNEDLKKGVSNFHNERTRANRLEQEVEQLRRSTCIGDYQVEHTRANRLQQEKDQLMVQYRELENRNAQLKTANQVCTVLTQLCTYDSTEHVLIIVNTYDVIRASLSVMCH